MVLNLKCIRDTLLALERCLVLNDELEFVGQNLDELRKSGELLQYSRSDLAYTLVLLTEADFIESYIDYADDVIEELTVIRLTYKGHQFLDSIRPDSLWKKIYSISEVTGLKSLSTVMQIADILLPETIKSALHS